MEHTPASPTLNSVLTGILSSTVLMFSHHGLCGKEIGGRAHFLLWEKLIVLRVLLSYTVQWV